MTTQAQANAAVAKALKTGDLERQPCEVCGTTERVQAHHDDYDRPLLVRWLCASHHMQLHGIGPVKVTRIAVTEAEWVAIRKAALDANQRTSELLGDLVRKYLKGRK